MEIKPKSLREVAREMLSTGEKVEGNFLSGIRWMLRKGPKIIVIKGKTETLPRKLVAVLTDPS